MNVWIAKSIVSIATLLTIAIRVPYGWRSRGVPIASSRRDPLERALLAGACLGFLAPLLWVVFPVFAGADYDLHIVPVSVGGVFLVVGLWMLWRAHADLGPCWSMSLEIRETHELVHGGVYRHLRHPMYTSFLLYAIGLALVIPNWIAGTSYGIALLLVLTCRLRREERMMVDAFGDAYRRYMASTKRLVPGLW